MKFCKLAMRFTGSRIRKQRENLSQLGIARLAPVDPIVVDPSMSGARRYGCTRRSVDERRHVRDHINVRVTGLALPQGLFPRERESDLLVESFDVAASD